MGAQIYSRTQTNNYGNGLSVSQPKHTLFVFLLERSVEAESALKERRRDSSDQQRRC